MGCAKILIIMLNLSSDYMIIPHVDFSPSITEPENSMSVQEIVNRHLRGQPVSLPSFDDTGDESLDSFPLDEDQFDALTSCIDQLDLTEIADMRARLNARAAEIRNSLKQNENEQDTQSLEDPSFDKPSAASDSVGPQTDA